MRNLEPKVVEKKNVFSNSWVTMVRKDVDFGGEPEDYYNLDIPDYVTVVATTPSGRVPLVRQYRPAVERFTLELPAGTLEQNETPSSCCVRELQEEVGHTVESMDKLGAYWPDTGRLGNQVHIFQATTREESPPPDFLPEPGVEAVYATPAELEDLISKSEFNHLLHISALYLAKVLPVK